MGFRDLHGRCGGNRRIAPKPLNMRLRRYPLQKNDLTRGARTRRQEAGEPPVPCFCFSELVPVAAHALLAQWTNGEAGVPLQH